VQEKSAAVSAAQPSISFLIFEPSSVV
jgi:hypothetical protein